MSVLDGPGEGTWAVFALNVVEERDALREKVVEQAKRIEKLLASAEMYRALSTATESASAALCQAVLNATVLRATCEKGDIHKSFRVHLLEAQWDEIVNLAKKLKEES